MALLTRTTKTFNIKLGERVVYTGRTGSGKTVGEAIITRGRTRTLIIDPKRSKSLLLSGATVVQDDPKGLNFLGQKSREDENVIFQPDIYLSEDEMKNQLEEILSVVFRNGRRQVLIDEINFYVNNAQSYPRMLKILQTNGREKEVGLEIGTQRPVGIPLFFLSEADHYFIFNLRLENDRRRVSEATEMPLEEKITRLKKHRFIYVNPEKERLEEDLFFVI